MRKLNGITIDGEFLGNSVVINGMFRAICTISPIVMRDFVYIINRVQQIDKAVKINTFNCPDTSSIDIEFSNDQTEGYATLFYTLQDSQPRLLDCNLVLGDEEVIGSLLDDEDFIDTYSPDLSDGDYDDYYNNGYDEEYGDEYSDEYDDGYSDSGPRKEGSGKSSSSRSNSAGKNSNKDNTVYDNPTNQNNDTQEINGDGAVAAGSNSEDAGSGNRGNSSDENAGGSKTSALDRIKERRSGARPSPMQERIERMKKQKERREQLKERVKQRREEINETLNEMQENALDKLKSKRDERRQDSMVPEERKRPKEADPVENEEDDDFIMGHASGAKEINDYTIIAKTLKIEAQNMEGFGFPQAAAGMNNQYNPYGNNNFGSQQNTFGDQSFNNSFDSGQNFDNFGNSGNDFGNFNNNFGDSANPDFNQGFNMAPNQDFGNGFNNPQQMGNMWNQPFGQNNGMSYPNIPNGGMPMPPRELYSVDENYNADDISDLYSDFYDMPFQADSGQAGMGANSGSNSNPNSAQNPNGELSELDILKAELEALKAANTTPEGLMTLEEFRAQQRELEEERLKASRRKMKIVGSRGQVNASALDGGVFVSGTKVYKWGDPRKLSD